MKSMNLTTVALLSVGAPLVTAFSAPKSYNTMSATSKTFLNAAVVENEVPFYAQISSTNEVVVEETKIVTTPETKIKKVDAVNKKKKVGGAVHKDGIFTPLVLLGKSVLGEDQLNKIRAKAISMHSDVIKNFVDTHSTPSGQIALSTLYRLADTDGDGTLNKEEIRIALNKLGFDWLKDKQVSGIVKRADLDENGVVDFDEFLEAAPKTLRTNLVKLAKKNGGDLGFLS